MKKGIAILVFCILIAFQVKAHVNLVYPVGSETFTAGETINIQWEIIITHNTQNWDLYLSLDGGNTWNPLKLDISVDSLNYHWVVPDSPTQQGQIRVVMDNGGGNYNDNSGDFTIETVTGIGEQIETGKLNIFPNPVSNTATISFENPNQVSYSIVLYNAAGQLVNEYIDLRSDKVIISRGNLSNGLYFIQLRTNNKIEATRKIIFR